MKFSYPDLCLVVELNTKDRGVTVFQIMRDFEDFSAIPNTILVNFKVHMTMREYNGLNNHLVALPLVTTGVKLGLHPVMQITHKDHRASEPEPNLPCGRYAFSSNSSWCVVSGQLWAPLHLLINKLGVWCEYLPEEGTTHKDTTPCLCNSRRRAVIQQISPTPVHEMCSSMLGASGSLPGYESVNSGAKMHDSSTPDVLGRPCHPSALTLV